MYNHSVGIYIFYMCAVNPSIRAVVQVGVIGFRNPRPINSSVVK